MLGRTEPHPGLIGAVCCRRGRPVSNEDNFYLNGLFKPLELACQPFSECCPPTGAAVFAVCDGMGGASYGEVASYLTVSRLGEAAPSLLAAPERGASFLRKSSHALRRESFRRRAELGAAVVLAIAHGNALDIFNVGDCRAYLFSHGRLTQLSTDHTAARAAQSLGLPIGRSECLRHQLVQYLGMDEEEFSLEPAHCRLDFPVGASLLLCSDGLTDSLGDQELVRLLSGKGGILSRAERLADSALEAGGSDNVTALVVYRNA